MLEIIHLPVLTDNYIYLLHDTNRGSTAVVDPAVAQPVLNELQNRNWQLDYVFNTHHHGDHVGGNFELKKKTGCTIVGAVADQGRIPNLDIALTEAETFDLGETQFKILETPGHTSGHIVFYSENANVLFCGDTLFAMGCGRLFEGSPSQMWHSLRRLRDLPDSTQVYCAHEYTQANGLFALTVEPDNLALQQRMNEVNSIRARNESTLPSTIQLEKETNPFFRADQDSLKRSLHMENSDALEVFTETRKRKDIF